VLLTKDDIVCFQVSPFKRQSSLISRERVFNGGLRVLKSVDTKGVTRTRGEDSMRMVSAPPSAIRTRSRTKPCSATKNYSNRFTMAWRMNGRTCATSKGDRDGCMCIVPVTSRWRPARNAIALRDVRTGHNNKHMSDHRDRVQAPLSFEPLITKQWAASKLN